MIKMNFDPNNKSGRQKHSSFFSRPEMSQLQIGCLMTGMEG
jgi:hypothetical protein